jgi:hypothetical protein
MKNRRFFDLAPEGTARRDRFCTVPHARADMTDCGRKAPARGAFFAAIIQEFRNR